MLIPLFEENRDTKELVVPEETMEALKSLRKHLNQLRNCLDSVAKGARSTWCVHFRESLFFFFFFFFGLDCVCLDAEKILEESARKSYCCCYN